MKNSILIFIFRNFNFARSTWGSSNVNNLQQIVLNINLINTITIMTVKMFGGCLPKEVLKKLDRIRGDIPRSRFLCRLIERLEEKQAE
jgi:hypothetical protein